MTHTTFKIDSNKSNFTFPTTDYSAILDNIITSNIKKCNPYLSHIDDDYEDPDFITNMMAASKKNHTIILNSDLLKENDKFIKAAKFLANYNKKKATNLPFILGKTYKLIDGTPIAFFDDEIQIGMDLYSYSDFDNIKFINGLSSSTKKIIINIFGGGNIKINIK